MLSWRIYYGDGSTFDSSQGAPEGAPSFDVQAVVQPHEDTGRQILSGFDFYYYHHGLSEWWGGDLQGVLDMILHNQPVWAFKQGRNAALSRYRGILERANTDPDFPRKSGRLPGDRA